jgi:pilus assembly protein FimV
MNNFKRVSAAVLAGTALLCASGASHGLGFGRPTSRAILGETLLVSVPLRLEAGEEVANECVAADVFFGDDKVSPTLVSASMTPGTGFVRTVSVKTNALINEPVVTVYLVAGCQAKITRKFVAFADPPGMAAPVVAEASPVSDSDVADIRGQVLAPVAPSPKKARVRQEALSQVTGPAKASQRAISSKQVNSEDAPSAATMQVRTEAIAKAPSSLDVVKPSGRKSTFKLSAAVSQTQPDSGRLVLDPAEADALVIPDLKMSAALGSAVNADDASAEVQARRATAAALWQALNASPEQMARDRQRLQELEQRLNQLRQESDLARKTVVQMQERVRQAEGVKSTGALFYVLLLVTAAAFGAAVYFYLQLRRRPVMDDAWWQSQSAAVSAESGMAVESELSRTSAEFVRHSTAAALTPETDITTSVGTSVFASAAFQSEPAAEAMPLPAALVATAEPIKPAAHEPLREVSVEELIDLEQQAEFFVVLGQDDAAIDLLESHVQGTTGASPLPFLKLLEIYQRLGKRQAYERIQGEFNQRFNAYAPAWESDLQQGHALSDYPGVIERLQSLWSAPSKAMDVLEKSITRPDDEVETFDLPAYRELLFLYAVARDLSEREAQARHSIDLLLPVSDSSGNYLDTEPMDDAGIEPLMATRPIRAVPAAKPSLSLDLQLEDMDVVDTMPLDESAIDMELDIEHIDLPDVLPANEHHKP